jgi:putative aldouronate transport system permease protein
MTDRSIITASNKRNRLNKNNGWDYLIIVLMALFMLLCVYPFWYVLIGSFSDGQNYLRGGVYIWPRVWSLQNYMVTLVDSRLYLGFRVTFLRTVLGTLTHVLFTSMVAYAMSRDDLPARQPIYWINIFTMFFGGGLVPFYILLKQLGLINTFWVYIIPGLYSVYNMIICSNYFRSISGEIHDSAMLDGASEFKTFYMVYLPLSTPVLATVALWVGVGHWNAFFDSMVFTTDRNLQMLQLYLYKMIKTSEFVSTADMGYLPAEVQQNVTSTTVRYATIIISTIPILCIYPLLQRFLTKGIMLGSLKG